MLTYYLFPISSNRIFPWDSNRILLDFINPYEYPYTNKCFYNVHDVSIPDEVIVPVNP